MRSTTFQSSFFFLLLPVRKIYSRSAKTPHTSTKPCFNQLSFLPFIVWLLI